MRVVGKSILEGEPGGKALRQLVEREDRRNLGLNKANDNIGTYVFRAQQLVYKTTLCNVRLWPATLAFSIHEYLAAS